MSDVRTERNGGNGVRVSGESVDRRITGVSTAGNGAFGLAVVGQRGAHIIGVATAGDKIGGLRQSRSVDTVVAAFTAVDEPIGVFTSIDCTNIVLDLQTAGGRRGVVAEKSTRGLTVTGSRLQGAQAAGVATSGQNVTLADVEVIDSGTGARVERGAKAVTITGLRIEGGGDGIVANAGTSGVVVRDLVANHVRSDAVRTFSPNTQIIGGRIFGGSTGINAGAATTISGTSISRAHAGIRSRSAELVHADRVDVETTALGIKAASRQPVPAHRVPRQRRGGAARPDRAAGNQRAQPAPAQRARSDLGPGDPSGHRARAGARPPQPASRHPGVSTAGATMPGGTSDFVCGHNGYGNYHIVNRHFVEWNGKSIKSSENWREVADYAIAEALRNPQKVAFRPENNTFCYSRRIYLINNVRGVPVDVTFPNVVVRQQDGRIVTAFPAGQQC